MIHRARVLAVFFLLGLTFTIYAQSSKPVPSEVRRIREAGAIFSLRNLFEKAPATDVAAARFAQGAQFLQLDESSLAEIWSARPMSMALNLPFHGETLTVDLVQAEILEAGFTAYTNTGEPVNSKPALHYRGVLRGAENSIAAFSILENDVVGIVSDEIRGNLIIGKVQSAGNRTAFLLYAENELAMDNPFECNVIETGGGNLVSAPAGAKRGNRSLRISLEADYALFRHFGDAPATLNYLVAMFNQVAALYANEQISVVLSNVVVRVASDEPAGQSSAAVLERFRQQRRDADLAQLVGLAGRQQESVAYLDALCRPGYAASFCNIHVSYSNVPTYAWTAAVMAHEIGHNLGARHTQWCGWPGGAIDPCQLAEAGCMPAKGTRIGSTVMSYCPIITTGINFSKGFGDLPGDVLRATCHNAPCLAKTAKTDKTADPRNTVVMPTESMNLSPNPATKQVTVQLHYDPQSAVRVVLLDLVGRALQTQVALRGDATLTIDLGNLQKGVYLVQVFENDQLAATKRLIKN